MRRNEREVTDRKEIIMVLKKALICRIAIHDKPYPYIVPLNFGVEDGEKIKLYFHCATEGKKLDLIRKNNKVSFEADSDTQIISGKTACRWSMLYRSVTGFGTIEVVNDPEERVSGLNLLMEHYSGNSVNEFDPAVFARTLILRLTVESLSCKKHGQIAV
jgi:uncharacterized protein